MRIKSCFRHLHLLLGAAALFLIPGVQAQEKPAPENDAKAVEVIDRYIDALGGMETMEAVTDKTVKFRVTLHAATGENVANMNLYMKKGYKVREEMNIEGVKIKDMPLGFIQVYNGMDGWVKELITGSVSPLDGKTLSLFVWDKTLDDHFCHWEEDGYSVKYISAGKVDEEDVDVIESTDFAGSTSKRYFFSKKSGLLLKSEGREQSPNGLVKKETFYKKYRPLPFSDNSGRKIPIALLHEIYGDGDLDSTREYTEIKINTNLDDEIFERPPGHEFQGAIRNSNPPPTSESSTGTEKHNHAHPDIRNPHPPVPGSRNTVPSGTPAKKAATTPAPAPSPTPAPAPLPGPPAEGTSTKKD